jgi:hypothetical protein
LPKNIIIKNRKVKRNKSKIEVKDYQKGVLINKKIDQRAFSLNNSTSSQFSMKSSIIESQSQ